MSRASSEGLVMVDVPGPGSRGVLDDQVWIHNLLDAADEVIYFKDLDSRFIRVSLGYARLHGRASPDDIVGLTDFDLFDTVHAQGAFADEQRIIATGEPLVGKVERETWHGRADTWVSSSKYPLRDPEGTVIGTFGVSRDITGRVQAERELELVAREREQVNTELSRVSAELRAVLAVSPDAISRYGPDLRYRYVNPACERLMGRAAEDMIGRTDRDLGTADALVELWETGLRRVLATGQDTQFEYEVGTDTPRALCLHAALTAERGPDGSPSGVLASVRNVTAMKRAERELAHRAMHDEVTGLPNRRLLMDRIHQSLVRLQRQPGTVALLFVDLDRFKQVNDEYGHDQGDKILATVAERLSRVARTQDTVARLGGDEFVILCEQVDPDTGGRNVAERIVDALAAPFAIEDGVVELGASVGLAVTADPDVDPSALLRHADAAMYRVKQAGGNGFRTATPTGSDEGAGARSTGRPSPDRP